MRTQRKETLLMSLTESEGTGEFTALLFVDTVVFRRRSSHFDAHKFYVRKIVGVANLECYYALSIARHLYPKYF